MAATDFEKIFKQFTEINVGVIGDLMLDTYWWGHVERISPEAPVPVVSLDRREYRIGGAGNVALNLASLGAHVSVFSVIGKDDDGTVLKGLMQKEHIRIPHLLESKDRISTNKTRIISRNQQMLRLDSETTRDLSHSDEDRLLERIEQYLVAEKPAMVIFEDYNKGILTEKVIRESISLCKKQGVFTAVDPKRRNFFTYGGVDIFKPNLIEVKQGLNLLLEEINIDTLKDIHEKLHEKLHHSISFVTLSEKGVFYESGSQAEIIPSYRRNIADVSGAGDTVIAVASLVYASTRDVKLMAQVANIAGGLVCEEVGTVAIDKKKLLRECVLLL
jgi:rfaE bifunctional protein kinase chain/domain